MHIIGATVTGTKSLTANLLALKKGIVSGSDDAVKIVAEEVAEMAQDFVPYDTGRTHDSIKASKVKHGNWVVTVDRGGIKPEVSIFLEYGTSRMAPRPFMQPAVDIVVSTSRVGAEIRATGGLIARGTI